MLLFSILDFILSSILSGIIDEYPRGKNIDIDSFEYNFR